MPRPAREERLTELAVRLSRTLAIARALIQGGRTIDLTGIDDAIGVLCAQTLDLPDGEARRVLPALRAVQTEVDLLSAMLRHQPAQHGVSAGYSRC